MVKIRFIINNNPKYHENDIVSGTNIEVIYYPDATVTVTVISTDRVIAKYEKVKTFSLNFVDVERDVVSIWVSAKLKRALYMSPVTAQAYINYDADSSLSASRINLVAGDELFGTITGARVCDIAIIIEQIVNLIN